MSMNNQNWFSRLFDMAFKGRRKPVVSGATSAAGLTSSSNPDLQPQDKALVASLAGSAPVGGWVTDHREEANHNTGFNYIAIHAISTQVMGAEVNVFSDTSVPEEQVRRADRRKTIREKHQTLRRYKALYGQEEAATKPLPITHDLVRLLKKPNPYETGAIFRYRQAQNIRLTGSCYVWNVPSIANGKTCQRYILPTPLVTPVRPSVDFPFGGWRVNPYNNQWAGLLDNGFVEGSPGAMYVIGKTIDARQVQIVRLPHAWRLDDGWSPVSAGSGFIDAAEAVNDARVSQMRNGCDPSIHLALPPDVNPEQDEMDRLTLKMQQKYGGTKNVGRVIITQHEATVTALTQTAKDMAYSEGFQDTKSATLALHQTPPVALGFQESGAYAAYFASMLAWRHGAIQPLCDMLAESDTQHIAIQFGEGITIEFEAPSVDDKDKIEKEFQNNVAAGICTYNELRAVRGLPPIPGPEGEELCGGRPAMESKDDGEDSSGDEDDKKQGGDKKKPSTPFMRKSLRAAWDTVEEADKEWLEERLKELKSQRVHIKPDGCSCAYPHTVLRNGSGHDPSCSCHEEYLSRMQSQNMNNGYSVLN